MEYMCTRWSTYLSRQHLSSLLHRKITQVVYQLSIRKWCLYYSSLFMGKAFNASINNDICCHNDHCSLFALFQLWKRSGAWFFKGIPKYILPVKTVKPAGRGYPSKLRSPTESKHRPKIGRGGGHAPAKYSTWSQNNPALRGNIQPPPPPPPVVITAYEMTDDSNQISSLITDYKISNSGVDRVEILIFCSFYILTLTKTCSV